MPGLSPTIAEIAVDLPLDGPFDYLIPTEKLDIVNYKNKKNIMTIDAEETFDETLEKLYKVVRKKNSKVYIKCALNKIFYVIEDYSHFVD